MNLLALRYFCHVAETESVTASASQLYISQPALSKMILQLERELGTSLFDRNGRQLTLNRTGKAFYQKVQSALLQIDDAVAEAGREWEKRTYQNCNSGTCRILLVPSNSSGVS